MPFIKFFWKDFKSDRAFNWFYILCASLGIMGLLLVESFKNGVEDKVTRNAKNFIASDISVSTRRNFIPEEKAALEEYLSLQKFEHALWIETYSLISKSSAADPLSKLANLNFVSEKFPFYGGVILENNNVKGPGEWSELHSRPSVWISRDLAWELGLKLNDEINVGEGNFVVSGIVIEDKFSSFRGFSLAPKIFLSYKFMEKTELVKFGSTATHAYAIKLPADRELKAVQQNLRKIIKDRSVKIVGPEESSQQISRSLLLLADYLSLITLLTYLLSLIGLYYFSQHFLSGKLKVFSIYKAMGIKTSYLFRVNFLHLITLTFSAVVVSTAIVLLILPGLESFFERLVGDDLQFALNLASIGRILLLSFVGSMLALGPLYWGALQIPVATVFQDLPAELKGMKFGYFLPLFFYIVILAIVLANSLRVGGLFVGALTLIVGLAALIFKIVTTFLEKSSPKFSFTNRHAAKTLSRYFTSSFTVFICLLLGMTLSTFIFQLEKSLRAEFTQTYGNKRPDLFIFDLQDSQYDEYQELVKSNGWVETMSAPMIRARLIKINDQSTSTREENSEGTTFSTREDENSERMRNRGVNLSFRSKLSWSETITEGKFNGLPCNPDVKPCEVSLEQSYARRLGAEIGDTLVFDVSGIEISAVVTSFRQVKWTSFEPNFFILFQPGVLEEAPKTYLASFKAEDVGAKRALFSGMARTFPNVSILDVSEVVKKITNIFDLMAMAIKFISILSLSLALIVLIAVSFNHLDLRKKEMTLFKMIGLRNQKIAAIYIREFSMLVAICIFLSVIFGSAMTFSLMKFIFNGEAFYRPELVITLLVLLSSMLIMIVKLRVNQLLKNREFFK